MVAAQKVLDTGMVVPSDIVHYEAHDDNLGARPIIWQLGKNKSHFHYFALCDPVLTSAPLRDALCSKAPSAPHENTTWTQVLHSFKKKL